MSESIADAISSANVDFSEEGEDIITGQQNKRKAQDQDDADDSHDEVAYDDDDNSHSVQSEYENVRDKNVEERQKMMNRLGLNSLFCLLRNPLPPRKRKGLRSHRQQSQQSQGNLPDLPRKITLLTFKNHIVIKVISEHVMGLE